MIRLTNVAVYNIPQAIKGMRNPLESWSKSDSFFEFSNGDIELNECYDNMPTKLDFGMGMKDFELALSLVRAGRDHSKFMRQILVSMDITASMSFFWDLDTYKIGTEKNSTSRMHKLGVRELVPMDFGWEVMTPLKVEYMAIINKAVDHYLVAKALNPEIVKEKWREMVDLLSNSFMFTRTWTGNYAVLREIAKSRRGHKQYEFDEFIKEITKLPYSQLITDGIGNIQKGDTSQ